MDVKDMRRALSLVDVILQQVSNAFWQRFYFDGVGISHQVAYELVNVKFAYKHKEEILFDRLRHLSRTHSGLSLGQLGP
jgi:hypothetical protein